MNQQQNPFAGLSPDDRLFLEEFGSKLARAQGVALLGGGFVGYGIARQLNRRRPLLWSALWGICSCCAAWGVLVKSESER
eukprot:4688279-Amphidinium_carterae.1